MSPVVDNSCRKTLFPRIGEANKLKQLTSLDQQRFLVILSTRTQRATRETTRSRQGSQGLWAVRFGSVDNVPGLGLTGTIGVQADLQGVEYYYVPDWRCGRR